MRPATSFKKWCDIKTLRELDQNNMVRGILVKLPPPKNQSIGDHSWHMPRSAVSRFNISVEKNTTHEVSVLKKPYEVRPTRHTTGPFVQFCTFSKRWSICSCSVECLDSIWAFLAAHAVPLCCIPIWETTKKTAELDQYIKKTRQCWFKTTEDSARSCSLSFLKFWSPGQMSGWV